MTQLNRIRFIFRLLFFPSYQTHFSQLDLPPAPSLHNNFLSFLQTLFISNFCLFSFYVSVDIDLLFILLQFDNRNMFYVFLMTLFRINFTMISYFANGRIRTLVHYCNLQLTTNKIYYFDDEYVSNSFSPDPLDEIFLTIFACFNIPSTYQNKKNDFSPIFNVELQTYKFVP